MRAYTPSPPPASVAGFTTGIERIFVEAASIVRAGRPVGLRLPNRTRLAMTLAAAGVRVDIDQANGVAHVRPQRATRREAVVDGR